LSGRGLCDELITRPEESYRLWCVVVCDLETSRMGAPYIYDISTLRVNIHQHDKAYFISVQLLVYYISVDNLFCTDMEHKSSQKAPFMFIMSVHPAVF